MRIFVMSQPKFPVPPDQVPALIQGFAAWREKYRPVMESFDFFAGGFVRHFEGWQPPKTDINRLHVLEMLNLLRSGEDSRIIAERQKVETEIDGVLARLAQRAAERAEVLEAGRSHSPARAEATS